MPLPPEPSCQSLFSYLFIHFLLRQRLRQTRLASNPVCSQRCSLTSHLSASISQVLGTGVQGCTTMPVYAVLGLKPRPLCMPGKPSTNSATHQARVVHYLDQPAVGAHTYFKCNKVLVFMQVRVYARSHRNILSLTRLAPLHPCVSTQVVLTHPGSPSPSSQGSIPIPSVSS